MVVAFHRYLPVGAGDVALSPQGTVPVCVGDLLSEFECTIATGREQLEWRINIMLENETMVDSYTRLVDTSGEVQTLMVHSIVFSFASSATSPLMSTLSISGVTANLASIGVICEDRLGESLSSALLEIIRSVDMVLTRKYFNDYEVFQPVAIIGITDNNNYYTQLQNPK
jgi:hypothetical protein